MENSLANFEMSESTVKIDSDSGSSEKSDGMEVVNYGDTECSPPNFDDSLPGTVTLLKHEATGAKVYLVGTAHFSRESQDDVRKVIEKVKPNVVMLELCTGRTNILSLDEETILEESKNISIQKMMSTIRDSGVYNGVMYLLLLNMSANITKQTGMAPGGEFRIAYKKAREMKTCEIILGDRPINVTLKRALGNLSWWQTTKLTWHILTSNDSVSVEEIERCKDRDMLEQLLADLAGEYPALGKVFLDERDIYLTNSLQRIVEKWHKEDAEEPKPPITVVGVVGIGHVPGIVERWPYSQRAFVSEIMKIPPPSLSSTIIKYAFKISLITFGGYMVYRFVPVPKSFKANIQFVLLKFVSSLKKSSNFKYTVVHMGK